MIKLERPLLKLVSLDTFQKLLLIVVGLTVLVFWGCDLRQDVKTVPKAKKGELFLDNWDFNDDGIISLKGEWAFYWKRLLSSDDFQDKNSLKPDLWQTVPNIWNYAQINGESLPGKGAATYRLVLKLDPEIYRTGSEANFVGENPKPQLAFWVRYIETAYEIIVDGKKIGGAGTVGLSREISAPEYNSKIYVLTDYSDTIEVILRVSNFHHRKGGIDSEIQLGTYSAILSRHKHALFIDVFIFGSILIMAIYHINLYFVRRSDKSSLYFGILCFAIGFRSIFVSDYFALVLVPGLNWRILLFMEYATFSIAFPAVAMFLRSLFPAEFSARVIKSIQVFTVFYMAFVLVTPPSIYSMSIIPYQIVLVVAGIYMMVGVSLALIRKLPESGYVFWGSVALLATTINDILFNNLILPTMILFPVGVFCMVLIQSFMLSKRYSKAFFELTRLKKSLEQRVSQRTKELSDKNEQMNRLIHVLCHDLRNPMVSIISIAELAESDPDIWEEMRDRLLLSAQNGLDIIDLVKKMEALDVNRFQLVMEPHPLKALIGESLEILSQKITSKNINMVIQIGDERVLVERTSFVNSVLNNILTNAIKFSYPGSSIIIKTEPSFGAGGYLTLIIEDEGIGMPLSLLKEVFNPVKTTSRPGTSGEIGTGFGMPLVKKFVQAYGGKITLKSKQKEDTNDKSGTRVSIQLRAESLLKFR